MCSTVQLSRSCCRMTASIFYHTVLSLSRTFLKSFRKGRTLFATAMIDYHIFKALSTTFFKKFLTGGFSSALSRDSYDRIAHLPFFVNVFFKDFKFFDLNLPTLLCAEKKKAVLPFSFVRNNFQVVR